MRQQQKRETRRPQTTSLLRGLKVPGKRRGANAERLGSVLNNSCWGAVRPNEDVAISLQVALRQKPRCLDTLKLQTSSLKVDTAYTKPLFP